MSAPRRRNAAAWQRREELATLVLGGSSVSEAAALVGITREAASRALSEPAVRELLAERRAELTARTRDAAAALHSEALELVLANLRTHRRPEDALAVLRLTLPTVSRAELAATTTTGARAFDAKLDTELEQLVELYAEGGRAEGYAAVRERLAGLVRAGELPAEVLELLGDGPGR